MTEARGMWHDMHMKDDLPDITPERVAELRKKAREVMAKSRAAKKAAMAERLRQPHLLSAGHGMKRCSVCKQPFFPDAKPSVMESFAKHVLMHHKPGQTTEDFAQAAARIVREATEDK